MPIGPGDGKWFVWRGLRRKRKLAQLVNGFLGDYDYGVCGGNLLEAWSFGLPRAQLGAAETVATPCNNPNGRLQAGDAPFHARVGYISPAIFGTFPARGQL